MDGFFDNLESAIKVNTKNESTIKLIKTDTFKMDYFDRPEMSQSKLKDLKKSPKHFWANHLDIDRIAQNETDEMKLGSLFHCLLLEGNYFHDRYIIAPQLDKRTKDYKMWRESKSCELETKTIITQYEYDISQKMIKALKSKKIIQILLSMNGLIENEFYWNDSVTNVPCKMKLDIFIEPCEFAPRGAIFDFKSTQDASMDGFSRSIEKYGYYNQEAFYCEGIKTIYDLPDYPDFYFIAIEKESPYESGIFKGDDVIMDIGLTENRKLLGLYKQCLESSNWYGYTGEVQTISLPTWAINKHYEGKI